MKIIDLRPDFIIDKDSATETIHIHDGYKDIPYGFFFTKYKFLSHDFKGNKILDKKDHIRTKSLWYFNFKDKSKHEVIPFGDYDINETSIIGDYFYFTKITDKDRDGTLKDDYDGGEIFRVKINDLQVEYCCDIEPYIFHGFEVATEQYIVFRSEDKIPNTDEIVFVDLKNKTKAILLNDWKNDEMDYKFIFDENGVPVYVITKKFVFENEGGSTNYNLGCFNWDNFLSSLEWENIK